MASLNTAEKDIIQSLQKTIGVKFKKKSILMEAITHKTYANEKDKKLKDNQRLEFLGDSVLSLIISEYIYIRFNKSDEGVLSKLKSMLISEKTLSDISKSMNLGNYIRLGHGEEASGGRYRDNMLEDLFESVVGAVYLDRGFITAKKFVLNSFKDILKNININKSYKDYKTIFQEIIQKKYKTTPIYKSTISKEENKNEIKFNVYVLVNDKKYGFGIGRSKKEAQTLAAKNALENINKKHSENNRKGKL